MSRAPQRALGRVLGSTRGDLGDLRAPRRGLGRYWVVLGGTLGGPLGSLGGPLGSLGRVWGGPLGSFEGTKNGGCSWGASLGDWLKEYRSQNVFLEVLGHPWLSPEKSKYCYFVCF